MFCDNCGDVITPTDPYFTLPDGDVVCEDCYEDRQDEYLADNDGSDPDAYDEAESEGE